MAMRDRLTGGRSSAPGDLEHQVRQLAEQVAALQARLEKAEGTNGRLRERAQRQGERLEKLRTAVGELRQQVRPTVVASNLREADYQKAMGQLAALEDRVGMLEEHVRADRFEGDAEAQAQARDLVEAVRREHDQVRVRMQIVSSYEERLRRVEATLVELYEGDHRHPV